VARRRDRRATVSALGGDARVRPGAHRHRGYGWEVATDLAYPLLDLGLLSLVATLLALTGWRPGLGWALFAVAPVGAGDLRRPVRARDRARHRLGDTLLAPMWPARRCCSRTPPWRPLSHRARSGVPLARVFIFPAAFTLLALGILVYDQIHSVNTLGVVLAATAIALAVARMALSFLDNLRMLRRARHDALTDALTGLRTAARSSRRSITRSTARSSRGCSRSSTSTASSATTTPTATRPATRC
jgi:hypothetical protein